MADLADLVLASGAAALNSRDDTPVTRLFLEDGAHKRGANVRSHASSVPHTPPPRCAAAHAPAPPSPVATVCRSDCDSQLIIVVPFRAAVRLTALKLVAVPGEEPTVVKLWVNKKELSFADVEGCKPGAELAPGEAQWKGAPSECAARASPRRPLCLPPHSPQPHPTPQPCPASHRKQWRCPR